MQTNIQIWLQQYEAAIDCSKVDEYYLLCRQVQSSPTLKKSSHNPTEHEVKK